MKTIAFAFALAALACGPLALVARADTADANCEVRKDGDTQRGKSGPCTFSQRQGFISIDLKNGDTLSLSPSGSGGQFRDQHGNKVHRLDSSSHTQEFKWEGGKHVTVTFIDGSHGQDDNHQGGHGGYRIEDIGNGNFEILWKSGCIADYDSRGRSTGYTQCNDEMKRRSDEVARERSR